MPHIPITKELSQNSFVMKKEEKQEQKLIITGIPETLKEVIEHHFNGGGFLYKSFNYKSAVDEYKETDKYKRDFIDWPPFKLNKYDIPIEIRERHKIIKVGKLRRVEFSNNGDINRIYIGSKYAIPIYQSDLQNGIVQLKY